MPLDPCACGLGAWGGNRRRTGQRLLRGLICRGLRPLLCKGLQQHRACSGTRGAARPSLVNETPSLVNETPSLVNEGAYKSGSCLLQNKGRRTHCSPRIVRLFCQKRVCRVTGILNTPRKKHINVTQTVVPLVEWGRIKFQNILFRCKGYSFIQSQQVCSHFGSTVSPSSLRGIVARSERKGGSWA